MLTVLNHVFINFLTFKRLSLPSSLFFVNFKDVSEVIFL